MKQFDFKYGRKQDTDDEKEENVILVGEYEYEDFGSFSTRNENCGDGGSNLSGIFHDCFLTNLFVLIDNVGGGRMKVHYLFVCSIQEFDGGEYNMTGLRITNVVKLKFVSKVNDKFAISKSQLTVIPLYHIFE
ncbi:hypothetical protein AVEN_137333-1 [Araneus ventricosus]|uniref:Uncharacterized protein n=1 Tax=Araneus ventricosus TaxID=182803 RepID=A0A4Y2FH96_ARAVE|nr:hypothetical protein AVEN_137333-1 [Araneus ventricosus]